MDRMSSAPESLAAPAVRSAEERRRAERFAAEHGLDYVDLIQSRIDTDLFHSIPFDLMLRYGFVPIERLPGRLAVALKDPLDVARIDELELQLGSPLEVRVADPAAIDEILQKSESTQRVLDEATEEFRIQLVQEDEQGEEVLSLDRITTDASPIIKLVDSTILNAIQRRASGPRPPAGSC